MQLQPSLEALPSKRPLHERLSTVDRLEIQRQLIEESGIDPMRWIAQHAKRFDEVTTKSRKLRELWTRDPDAAKEVIRRYLDANSPDRIAHRDPMR